MAWNIGRVVGIAWALLLPLTAQAPLAYTVRVPDPTSPSTSVEVRVPTDGKQQVELFLPVWSPGYYRVENYHTKLRDLTAADAAGAPLAVEQPQPNRWRIAAHGDSILVRYTLQCTGHSVTTNWVDATGAIWCGPATFVGLLGGAARKHEVALELPATWPDSATALVPYGDGRAHHYVANHYDELLDAPILAGALATRAFDAGGVQVRFVDWGKPGAFDSSKACELLGPVIAEHARFCGGLPFDRYVFLNAFRQGGGGLEHSFSSLLTTAPQVWRTPNASWLSFVSHEFFHAINVKRLRPVELGPFDYEHPPQTGSLWIAEGMTTYFGDLAVVRSGVATQADWLVWMSTHIRQLQTGKGRSLQTLEQASLQVWDTSMSGVGGNPDKTVNYYVKGPCVGFVLDAAIRRATDGKRSFDDVMRLGLSRWAQAQGYTHDQFLAAIAEVGGAELAPLVQQLVRSTEEIDWQPTLDWFGLEFGRSAEGAPDWRLQLRADAPEAARAHLAALLAPTPARSH